MLPGDPATFARVASIIEAAFGNARDELDTFAAENALMSDEIMALVNGMHTDFAYVYAQHICDGWDWENSEVVEG